MGMMGRNDEGTARPSAESILRWYRDDVATMYAAHGWYTIAGRTARELGREYGVTRARAAGVIAAMSPMNEWRSNILAARRILTAAAAGKVRPPANVGLRANVRKAWAIANGARPLDILRGPKVRAFYRNIMGDLSAVTVDRWAARAAGVGDAFPSSPARYELVAAAYREAAELVGIPPAILQAVVWCSIRGKAE